MNKAILMATLIVVSSLVGCYSVVISTTPRPDEYFVNGLDVETQHLKLEGIGAAGTGFLFPGFTYGVDVWLGFNLAAGHEGHRDQATSTMVIGGLPANFDVMDAILTGQMDGAGYAAFAAPILVEKIRADPAWPNIQARLMEAWADANANVPEHVEQFKDVFVKEFGYWPEEITPAEIDRALPAVAKRLAAEGAFTGLKTLMDSVKEITPEGFTFAKGTWDVVEFANAMKVLDAIMKSGDADLIQKAQQITTRLLEKEDGTFTVDTLNGVFRDLNALGSDISPEYVFFGNAGIGIFWFGIMWVGEEAFGYYKQVVLPIPISIPGYATLPRITLQIATQIPAVDLELTDLQLDPLALPITLPILRAPLVGFAASGKEMTFSTTVINIGFETGEYVLSEQLPGGWKGTGTNGIVSTIRPFQYQVHSYATEVPIRASASIERLTTHLDSIDIDERERAGSGQAGDTTLNNANEFLAGFPLWDSTSFVVTKPLDLIVVEELDAEDGLSRAFAAYDSAALPPEAPADPRGETEYTVNDALDGVAAQVRALRLDAFALLAGEGVDVWAEVDAADVNSGDEEGAVEAAEDTRLSIAGPASPTATWTDAALGSGTRLTFVSTPQELVDTLIGRVNAAGTGNAIAAWDAIPSAIVMTTAAPGLAGPAELLVNALNLLGVGLVQDADGYATNPLLFSPGSGVVVGTGPTAASGVHGALSLPPAFALTDCSPRSLLGFTVSPKCTNDATLDSGVTGVWKATGTETGAADTAAAAMMGATSDDPQSAVASTLATFMVNYGDLLADVDAIDDAGDARRVAQGVVGAKTILVPAGHGAVTSFRLGGATSGFLLFEVHGRATLLAADVQSSVWGAAFAESARDAGFGIAVSLNLGGVPTVFGSS